MTTPFVWTHDSLQKDLYLRRRGRSHTAVWLEIQVSDTDPGRLDVYEARYHDAKDKTTFVGFEVKARIEDIRKDLEVGKWRRYLHVCDELYFAFPAGLVEHGDIPEIAGIMERVGDRSGRWQIRRRPKGGHRQVDDRDVWRRLALRDHFRETPVVKTRLERMRDYKEMDELSGLLAYRVLSELRGREYAIEAKQRDLDNLDEKRARFEELQVEMAGLPERIAAVNTLTNELRIRGAFNAGMRLPMMTVDEAVAILARTEEEQ